jgi:murein DD-endopeptidase MepM/ murein hydrolase activator NlpD
LSETSATTWKPLRTQEFDIDRNHADGHLAGADLRSHGTDDALASVAERYDRGGRDQLPPRGRVSVLRAAITVPLLALAAISVTGLLDYRGGDDITSTAVAAVETETRGAIEAAAAIVSPAAVTAPIIAPQAKAVGDWVQTPPDLDAQRDPDSNVRLVSVADWRLEEAALEERSRQVIRVNKGDTLTYLLTDAGVSHDDALQTVSALKLVYDPRRIWPGQEIALNFDPLDDGPSAYEGLSIDRSYDRQIVVARGDDGGFTAKEVRRELTREPAVGQAVISSSLFEAGAGARIPAAVLVEMIRAFSYDVDFQREIHDGDSFEILYERIKDESGDFVHPGNVVYAKLVLGGDEKRIFRFTPKSGITDFFHENGHSVRRALLRTPIDGARISSGFGKRKHPILGYSKMHKGVDFAAPRGTPIYAAGNGIVERAGRNGAYGNYIRLKHSSTYKTAYAHLQRIATGIRSGAKVKQGQIIGYVGTTGRSTGPHLHYEVLVQNHQVNPLGVKLPAGEQLKGKELERFRVAKAEIERTYATLTGATRFAQNTQ